MKIIIEHIPSGSFDSLNLLDILFLLLLICFLANLFIYLFRKANNFVMRLKQIPNQ